MPYRIEYTQQARAQIHELSARDRSTVIDSVERQLQDQPTAATRNRKLMRSNVFATWELRVGDFRVYYDVEDDPEPAVYINAIGIKRGNKVFIGGEEVELS